MLRLDRTLARLLEMLDALAGPDGWVLALPGDRGAPTFPELSARQGVTARRRTDGDEVFQGRGPGQRRRRRRPSARNAGPRVA